MIDRELLDLSHCIRRKDSSKTTKRNTIFDQKFEKKFWKKKSEKKFEKNSEKKFPKKILINIKKDKQNCVNFHRNKIPKGIVGQTEFHEAGKTGQHSFWSTKEQLKNLPPPTRHGNAPASTEWPFQLRDFASYGKFILPVQKKEGEMTQGRSRGEQCVTQNTDWSVRLPLRLPIVSRQTLFHLNSLPLYQ